MKRRYNHTACRTMSGGNWWRANEISINHLTHERDVGDPWRDKTSPDLNPIEQVFAKFKTLLRKAEARTTRPPTAPHTSKTQDMRKPKSRQF